MPISAAIFNGPTGASMTQLLAAACLMAVVPAILTFLAPQRVTVRAVMADAING